MTRAKARVLPPIPATVPSILGPVPVTQVRDLKDERGRACRGIWRGDERDVRMDPAQELVTAWQTYWHEWTHIALSDAGIHPGEKLMEAICDAFGNARTREMLDG